jgi:hypothetical protein
MSCPFCFGSPVSLSCHLSVLLLLRLALFGAATPLWMPPNCERGVAGRGRGKVKAAPRWTVGATLHTTLTMDARVERKQDSPSAAPRDRPFDGWRVPATDKARALVAEVVRRVEAYEHHFRLRKLTRSARHQATFEATIAAIVVDVVHHHLSRGVAQNGGDVAVPRDKRRLARRSRYRPPALGEALPHVLDIMAKPELRTRRTITATFVRAALA